MKWGRGPPASPGEWLSPRPRGSPRVTHADHMAAPHGSAQRAVHVWIPAFTGITTFCRAQPTRGSRQFGECWYCVAAAAADFLLGLTACSSQARCEWPWLLASLGSPPQPASRHNKPCNGGGDPPLALTKRTFILLASAESAEFKHVESLRGGSANLACCADAVPGMS